MRIINCTPHEVIVITACNEACVYKTSGTVARLETVKQQKLDDMNGHEIWSPPIYTDVVGIPEGKDAIIVSMVVADFIKNRKLGRRIFVPDTGPEGAIRDASGRITGTKRLMEYHPEI